MILALIGGHFSWTKTELYSLTAREARDLVRDITELSEQLGKKP